MKSVIRCDVNKIGHYNLYNLSLYINIGNYNSRKDRLGKIDVLVGQNILMADDTYPDRRHSP